MPSEITREEVCAAMRTYLKVSREYWVLVSQYFCIGYASSEQQHYVLTLNAKAIGEIQSRRRILKRAEENYERKYDQYRLTL